MYNLIVENTPDYVRQIYQSNFDLWNLNKTSFTKTLNHKTSIIKRKFELVASDTPDISVIIPARNEEKYILMTLESLSNQNTNRKFEVIVVINNNSLEDITSKICEKCGVKVINYNFSSKKHKPISLARQIGLIQSKGKFIFSTDSDAIIMPNWIEDFSNVLEKDSNVGYVTSHSRLYFWEDDEKVKANDIGRVNIRKIVNNIGASGLGNNMAFRKEYAEKRGGWNTKIYPSEDTEMGLRLTKLINRKAILVEDLNTSVWISPRRIKEHGKNSFLLDFFTSYININGEHINVR
jgi:glycosyltransferase involved in cell wall biosynthesis